MVKAVRLLVTGASGLLGVNLAHEVAKEHSVVGVVNERVFTSDTFEVRRADLLAPNAIPQLLDESQPDWFIHCAAIANVDECEQNPDLAYLTNAELPGEIARQVAPRDIPLIYISTDAVFDGERGDYDEEDEPNPLSTYAKTKLIGEQGVADAYPEAIIARVNMFGWSLTGKRSLAEFFFYNLRDGNPVKGFTDVFFCPMLVNDLAGVLIDMLEKGLSGLYHVVSPDCMSKYDFGVSIAEKFGLDAGLIAPVSVAEGGLAAARSPNLTLKSDKLAGALGSPLPRIEAGLSRLYALQQKGYPTMLRESVASDV
jgi:dTDP-4-dehydrorhamnose reductase